MKLHVNNSEVIALTNKLEELNRSAFPIAVRSTLNSAAFDMKKDTILKSAKDNFVQRKPTFFKANSRVNTAKGFDVTTMQSEVGFTGNSQAVDDLEKQEHGGQIGSRDFLPYGGKSNANPARSGSSYGKNIKPNARLKDMKFTDAKDAKAKTEKQKFIRAVIDTGAGGFVLGNTKPILWKIISINKSGKNRFKLTPLYTFKDGRKVNVESTNFMKEATEVTTQKMDNFYLQHAQTQFEKALK